MVLNLPNVPPHASQIGPPIAVGLMSKRCWQPGHSRATSPMCSVSNPWTRTAASRTGSLQRAFRTFHIDGHGQWISAQHADRQRHLPEWLHLHEAKGPQLPLIYQQVEALRLSFVGFSQRTFESATFRAERAARHEVPPVRRKPDPAPSRPLRLDKNSRDTHSARWFSVHESVRFSSSSYPSPQCQPTCARETIVERTSCQREEEGLGARAIEGCPMPKPSVGSISPSRAPSLA